MYTKSVEQKVENRLLATHIAQNPDFESACYSGNSIKILEIIDTEMERNNLFTKGSQKLKADIVKMLQGRPKVSRYTGENILMFVWNSRLSGTGYAVIK